MDKKKIKIIFGLLVILVIALGGYFVYLEVSNYKNHVNNLDNKEEPIIEEESLVETEQVVIKRIDLCENECEEALYEIKIGDQTFNIVASLYEEEKDILKINDKEIEFSNDNLQFIALMNYEFLVIGTNHKAPEEVFEIIVLDLNLDTVEMFKSYMHENGEFDLTKNIFENNTKMYYYACEEDEEDSQIRNYNTYEVSFSEGQINKKSIKIERNISCASEL